ncbi:hypothetical protein [Effusibacillus dendaii]|uniref:DUF5590 domain-containing protein n=1 Tax=Effusibacillus dendaii TaxID=2743772 RepID=A0A7I8D5K9_9BACL|nr:hypothetical protein [Effusibacillus dendaii]BCJ85438.1 hypothetical protein skT53_04230 [Effusibacillus dendaii]
MRKILFYSLSVCAIVIIGTLFLLRQLTYAQMPDLQSAAQTAVDHSALFQIVSAEVYSNGPSCFVFTGTDKLGREMIVVSSKDRVLGSEYTDKGLKRSVLEDKARANGFQRIDRMTLGIVDPNGPNPFKSNGTTTLFWEIYGVNQQGKRQYSYLDFYTGNLLATYSLEAK